MLVLAFVGLADASYLTFKHYLGSDLVCVLGLDGCQAVTSSIYNTVFDFPLALGGLLFYLSLIILIIWWRQNLVDWILALITFLIGSALGFSFWLFYIQWKILESWCSFCLLSFGLIICLFIISLFWVRDGRVEEEESVSYLDYDSAF